jgi:RNA polymerase sigma factor (sigma-70 family)
MKRVDAELDSLPASASPDELIALDEALNELRMVDPQAAKLVELVYFGGLTQEQAAQVLKISRSTVVRIWATTRVWLHTKIAGQPTSE